MRADLEGGLRAGLQQLELELEEGPVAKLMDYLALIQKWNKVYNLTAVHAPADMLTHHLLDSLAVIAPLRRHTGGRSIRLLDVGSGAGLPGVVIAICCPEVRVDCVDAVAKKVAFIRQSALALGVANLAGVHARVESLGGPYDVVCSRAFASLADFTALSGAALSDTGVWMAMKARHAQDELAALPPEVEVFHVEQLSVPGLDAERCIVWLKKAQRLT